MSCWLCEGLGAIAIHNKWTAEHGRTVWIAHKPTSRTHPVQPCPVCQNAQLSARLEYAERLLGHQVDVTPSPPRYGCQAGTCEHHDVFHDLEPPYPCKVIGCECGH